MITKSNLNNYLKNYNIKATSADIEKIFLYTDLIFKNNLKFNITGTREKDEILKRHILDSLSFFIFFNKYKYSFEDKKFIDIGTGGGLPGLAIAVF